LDFLERLKEFLESLDTFVDHIAVGVLSDGNSIAFRPIPAQPPIKYLDGRKSLSYGFQVLVRHSDQLKAIQTIESISQTLDDLPKGAIKSENNSFAFLFCSISTPTNYVEQDSSGWVYTALFSANLSII